eukprot:CAMPEP_0118974020 /NCGR_PEP_ID=MMETSP1173-20130426/11030_1 /TAXON_ID=1034831 /ORGANISM="Rhizochromulina marina cf, Strain CCMP1243" /LENGTH=186 /DNA_ID=CAMNT_0006923721 /DNA_START=46 /DNA_END=606 /DNA_ORIENTATION=+
MVKYSMDMDEATDYSKAKASSLRVHFKHTREIMHTIKGMQLAKALKFLEDVLQYKQAVPFTKFTGGIGRHAQLKQMKAPGSKGRWPQKATKVVLDLVKNAEANAETKGLDTDKLFVKHAQANRAQKQRRRTYRAHGRINPYMSSPAHIELILASIEDPVAKAEDAPQKLTRRRQAQLRVKVGGGDA